jgi:hypothetical protein
MTGTESTGRNSNNKANTKIYACPGTRAGRLPSAGARPVGETGRVSVFLAIALAGVLILVGMVDDGGGRLRAMQRADNIAAEAARAAGQAIDGPAAIQGGDKLLERAQAVRAAQAYLAAAGVRGTVSVSGDRKSVQVGVEITEQTAMLSLIGISSYHVTGTATAVLVTDDDQPG